MDSVNQKCRLDVDLTVLIKAGLSIYFIELYVVLIFIGSTIK